MSNTGQGGTGIRIVGTSGGSVLRQAQRFTTGDVLLGYTLASVRLHISHYDTGDTAQVSIRAKNASGNPGSSLHVLVNPSISADGMYTFTAPTDAALDPETDYFVLVEAPTGSFSVGDTSSDAEDAVAGWSIFDERHQRQDTLAWVERANALRIAVDGTGRSDDATLSGLVVNDGTSDVFLSPAFAADKLDYEARVPVDVARVTVTPTANESTALVAYVDGDGNELRDADGVADGHQVDLAVGRTVVGVRVTAPDRVNAQTYTVSVTRADVLVSNTSIVSTTWDSRIRAQRFRTGARARGYEVIDVELLPVNTSGRRTVVSIRRDSGGEPGEGLVATLANPDTLRGGVLNRFAAPAGTMLEAGKAYWVSVNEGIGSGTNRVRFRVDSGDTETGEPGWSIANTSQSRFGVDDAWDEDNRSLIMAVNGVVDPFSADATLRALSVGYGTTYRALTPGFAPDVLSYAASVADHIARVTVTATRNEPNAEVEFVDGNGNALADADAAADGQQVDLAPGANVVGVRVTAHDGETTQTYTVTVTRATPSAGCATGDTWCDTMTVGTWGSFGAIAGYGYYEVLSVGSLSNSNEFDHEGVDYRVVRVVVTTGGHLQLEIRRESLSTRYEWAGFVLYADGEPFALDDAAYSSGYFRWSGSGLGWSDADTVELRLAETAANSPATGAPAVSGEALLGHALAAEAGDIADADGLPATTFPDGYSFQWLRVDATNAETPIAGATAATYTAAAEDLGSRLRVAVSFGDGAGYRETAASEATAAVAVPPGCQAADVWCATMTVEEIVLLGWFGFASPTSRLPLGMGALSDTGFPYGGTDYSIGKILVIESTDALEIGFRPDDGDAVFGALALYVDGVAYPFGDATFEPSVSGDADFFRWAGSDPGWSDGDTVVVRLVEEAVNTPATGAPTILGNALVGQTLTAEAGDIADADGLPETAFPDGYAFQWLRVDASDVETPIAGATSATYTAAPGDVGARLAVAVSFTDEKGFAESRTSEPTAVVALPTTPGLVLSKTSLTLTEGGSDSYTVALATQPTGNVTVTITGHAGTDLDLTPNPAILTFTTVTWNQAQTVAVSAEQDDDAEDDEETLKHEASGGDYGAVAKDLRVTVDDDDTAALVLSTGSLDVTEGASKTYTVKLATRPTGNVTVTITGHAGTDLDLTPDPAILTFTTENWNAAQNVAVSAAEDGDADNDEETLKHEASGGGYGAVAAKNLPVTVADNDVPGLLLSKPSLNPPEGGSESYTVKLATVPTGNVTVTITGHVDTDLTPDPAILTFTTENWNAAQTVAVSAERDDDAEDDEETLKHEASGGGYGGVLAKNLPVTVKDDDTREIVLSKESLNPPEGGSESYTVALATQPTANVTVTIAGHAGTDLTPDRTSLTFTTETWDAAQTVTVSAAQDDDASDDRATLKHEASGGGYGGVPAKNLAVRVEDDETPPLTLTVEAVKATVTEGEPVQYRIHMSRRTSGAAVRQRFSYEGEFVPNGPSSVVTEVNTRGLDELYWERELATDDDEWDEADGRVTVTLEKPEARHYDTGEEYTIGTPSSAAVAILDNDDEDARKPVASVEEARVREGPDAELVFEVRLDSAPAEEAEVAWRTIDGDAKAGSDYVDASGTLRFGTGDTVKTVRVAVLDDDVAERREKMYLLLRRARGLEIEEATTAGIIDDDDAASAVARVDGPLLTLRYAEPPDAGSTPGPKDWVVAAESAAGRRTLAVTAVSVSGFEAALWLSPPAMAGESVSVSYLPWAVHPLLLGPDRVEAPPLTELLARNETAPAAAGPPPGRRRGVDGPPRLEDAPRSRPPDARPARRDPVLRLPAALLEAPPPRLDLRGLGLADVSALAGLAGLEALDLSGNRVADVWPLAGLVELRRLDLSDNRIADVAALAELAKLEVLDLRGNAVADAWPLAGLAGLRRLDLSGNRIADVSALGELGGLEVLVLDGNRVRDVLPLALLPRLARLDLAGNRVADAAALAEPVTLVRLDLAGNRVGDASPLGDLSALVWLDVSGNPVSDLAPLGRLTALRWLWLDAGAAVGALAPLAERPAPVRIELRPAGGAAEGSTGNAPPRPRPPGRNARSKSF